MGTATITVSDEVKAEFKRFSWVNWSELAREDLLADIQKQELLEQLHKRAKEIVSKSKFTVKDAEFFSEKVKKSMHDDLVKKKLI